jgi:hypothetical protein
VLGGDGEPKTVGTGVVYEFYQRHGVELGDLLIAERQIATVLASCERLRDRMLFTLLAESGLFSRAQPPCASVIL